MLILLQQIRTMTEIKPQKSAGRKLVTGIVLVLSLGMGIFFMFNGCAGNISPEAANMILEKKGKQYLFSALGSTAVKQSIEKGESPAAFTSIQVYKDGDVYYVHPADMEPVVNVMAEEVELHDYKEASYDGYVTGLPAESFELKTHYRSTKTIGQQLIVSELTIRNKQKKSRLIKWEFDPKTGEYTALKNCEVHSFWIQTNPSPGETVISSKDFLVVPIDELAGFFGVKAEYSEETQLLFIRP